MENKNSSQSKTSEMVIGKTRYIITTHYNENGRETAEDKLVKIVADQISAEMRKHKNMEMPLAI